MRLYNSRLIRQPRIHPVVIVQSMNTVTTEPVIRSTVNTFQLLSVICVFSDFLSVIRYLLYRKQILFYENHKNFSYLFIHFYTFVYAVFCCKRIQKRQGMYHAPVILLHTFSSVVQDQMDQSTLPNSHTCCIHIC